MKEKKIINNYISILNDKEKYFENMESIYKLLKVKSFLLVKKLVHKDSPEILKHLVKKENKIIKEIKLLEERNKILEEKQNIKHLFNMNFMSLEDNSLLITDQILGFIDELTEEEKNTNIHLNSFYLVNNKNMINLEVFVDEEKLEFLLVEENFYKNIDKEKLRKYNYIVYRGDSSLCIENFMKLLSLDLKKEKVKRKKLRRIYDKY